jgi:hypothetical protein
MIARTKHFTRIALLFSLAGCGYGQFQTARTTPPGEVHVTAAQLYVYNENTSQRADESIPLFSFPQELDLRVGLSDQMDLGAKLFLLWGILADTKVNLMPNRNDFALAIHGGLGAALVDPFAEEETASVVHLPLGVIASYRFFRQLSPYLSLDYGFYWIFERELEYRDPKKVYAKRRGYGDGVGRITAGLEWELGKRLAFLLEYDLLVPLIDDPGDNFAFVTNHIVGIGVRF